MCVLCVLHLLFSVLDAAAREDCILAWITFYRVGSPMNEISIDHTSVRWGLRSTKGFTISQMVDKIVKNCFLSGFTLQMQWKPKWIFLHRQNVAELNAI